MNIKLFKKPTRVEKCGPIGFATGVHSLGGIVDYSISRTNFDAFVIDKYRISRSNSK